MHHRLLLLFSFMLGVDLVPFRLTVASAFAPPQVDVDGRGERGPSLLRIPSGGLPGLCGLQLLS